MRIVAAALLVLSCATACVTSSPADATATVKQVERRWLDAYEARDAVAMDAIVADGFTITYPDGSVQTKEQVVDFVRKAHARGGASPKFHTEDVQARQHGDVVVLTGIVVTEFTKDDATSARVANRYTDTYKRFGNEWRVIASHLSNAKQSGEPK